MSMGCIDKNDCAYVNTRCLADPDCALIAAAYFTDCQQFVERTYTDGSLNECPAACDESLTAYLEYNYGLVPGQSISEYCNCNGGEECIEIVGWYDELGCGEIEEPTTTDDEPTGSPSAANSNNIIQILCTLAIIKAIVM